MSHMRGAPVGEAHDEYVIEGIDAIHLDQKLVDDGIADAARVTLCVGR